MSLVNLTMNGKAVSVPADTMILEAAKQVNIKILVFYTNFSYCLSKQEMHYISVIKYLALFYLLLYNLIMVGDKE